MEFKIIKDLKTERAIITKCDSAFTEPMSKRTYFHDITVKINTYGNFIALEKDGEAVGYAAFYANNFETKVAYISLLVVDKKHWGHNYGKMLIDKVKEMSKEIGMTVLRLAIRKNEFKSLAVFIRNGFDIESEEPESYYLTINL